MKLLGLIGGVSPESTQLYYRLLNDSARARFGGAHSARLIVWSFDFALIDEAYAAADWDRYRALVVEAARALKAAGAEALMICSNTTHLAAEAVEQATGLPLIHLIDALAAALKEKGVRKPLLLGTPFVMSGPFYRPALARRFGADAIVPDTEDQEEARRIIFDELVRDEIKDSSRARLRAMIEKARRAGADGVILGCTEFALILSQDDTDLPVFDTTRIHAAAAADYAFGAGAGR
ncbi:MAG: aspartate/glutamate racemase family protein [Amphiplicatus sp.]